MRIQDLLWTTTLAAMGLVALGFILVIIQAGKPADDEATAKAARTARRLQGWVFGALLVIFVVGTWATLHRYPIPPQHGALDAQQVVDVVGGQWYWKITPSTVPVGTLVEFRVTSVDVNHGFAIYAPDGRIVAQTQAMPGYTNKLLHTFTVQGTYTIQCLEYCGVGHAPMVSAIDVIAAREQ
ncbi:MAG: hypothetical protein R2909_03290 [Gemmatimonadales bacterium]